MKNETIYEQSLRLHKKAKGKFQVVPTVEVATQELLSLVYTPGVAEPCREIVRNPEAVYELTTKSNTIAVVTDGTAVLGLGNIGPEAAMPVMEGKAVLFKQFGGLNAVPVCLNAGDPNDPENPKRIIEAVKMIAPTYGGINLEDISAPRCVEIERALVEALDIPVMHDDQHGTAIVVAAGLLNALKVVKKKMSEITVVVSGTGAAGSAIIKMLHNLGVGRIYAFNINGIVRRGNEADDFVVKELSLITNPENYNCTMAWAMEKADVFIGVSKGGIVTREMVSIMKKDPIVFAMANPDPEITYDDGKAAGAKVMATGRSDSVIQVNNLLAFPGIFAGAIRAKATKITQGMKMAAVYALAGLVREDELSETYILPKATNPRVARTIASAVAEQAIKEGCIRKK